MVAREGPAPLYGTNVACAEIVREYGPSRGFGNVAGSLGFWG